VENVCCSWWRWWNFRPPSLIHWEREREREREKKEVIYAVTVKCSSHASSLPLLLSDRKWCRLTSWCSRSQRGTIPSSDTSSWCRWNEHTFPLEYLQRRQERGTHNATRAQSNEQLTCQCACCLPPRCVLLLIVLCYLISDPEVQQCCSWTSGGKPTSARGWVRILANVDVQSDELQHHYGESLVIGVHTSEFLPRSNLFIFLKKRHYSIINRHTYNLFVIFVLHITLLLFFIIDCTVLPIDDQPYHVCSGSAPRNMIGVNRYEQEGEARRGQTVASMLV